MTTRPTISLAPDGDGAALTVDGVTVATVTRPGIGPVVVTLPGSTGGVAVERAADTSRASSGLTVTGSDWTVGLRGRPAITGTREAPDTSPTTPTPSGVAPLVGQDAAMYALADAFDRRRHVHLQGPTGCGKSTAVRLMAEARGWSFVGVTITPGVEAADLLGGLTAVPSAPGEPPRFDRVDGPVTTAVRRSQERTTVLLLDEWDRADRVSEYTALYPVLDGQGYLLVDGERIAVGDLIVVATSNGAQGDYVGTHRLDPALSNRVGYRIMMDYPSADAERSALVARVPGLDADAADVMIDVVSRCRTAPDVSVDIGFRTLVEWAGAVATGRWSVEDAAAMSIVPEAGDAGDAVVMLLSAVTAERKAAAAAAPTAAGENGGQS